MIQDGVKGLHEEHQQMARLLQEAEQQGLVDVFLVIVTHHAWFCAPHHCCRNCKQHSISEATVTKRETTVDKWTRLDDDDVDWKQETLDTDKGDCILQVSLTAGSMCCQSTLRIAAALLHTSQISNACLKVAFAIPFIIAALL